MASDDSCRDVAALAERIASVGEKQRQTDANLLNGLMEIKGILAGLRQDLAALVNQTNTQETRIVVVERETERNTRRVDQCESTIAAHGRRLAQLGLAAVCLSVVLPVTLEHWLGQPPASEVAR